MGLVFGRRLTRVMRSPSGRRVLRGSAHRSDVIGHAKQWLMHRFDLDVAQAVSLLCNCPRSSTIRLKRWLGCCWRGISTA
jgi:hypothetical protein